VSDGDSRSTGNQASARVPCLCAPTSHPGSFRCHLHRASDVSWGGRPLRPSAHAKALRNAELPPVKAADLTVGLKKAGFARTNRASTPSKLRSELSKAMPDIVAAVGDLRISPQKTQPKRSKILPAPVPRAGMAKVSNNVPNEKTAQSDAVPVKGSAEAIHTMRPHSKAAKRPTSFKDRRLRAKSDVMMALKL